MLITTFSDCQGLDFVISEARKYGVRLILALTNNYQDYGGRPQYVKWARSAGVAVNGDDDFYTNAVVKGYYKNHVKVNIVGELLSLDIICNIIMQKQMLTVQSQLVSKTLLADRKW